MEYKETQKITKIMHFIDVHKDLHFNVYKISLI